MARAKSREQLILELADLRKQIDEMKRSETDCLFEEGLYRSLERSSRAGIYVLQDGKFRFVNEHAARYWGYNRNELIGKESMSLVHPDHRERVRKHAIAMLKGRRSHPYEFMTIGKNGDLRWIAETVTPIHYRRKRAVLGNSMDVTRQVQARTKLAELEALEASILDAIPHAVIGLRNRRIIFANNGVESVFGRKASELIGRSTRLLYPTEEGFREIAKVLYSNLERQRTFSFEFTCRRRDGSPFEALISASRIGDTLQEKRIVIVYEDITDRRRAEESYKLFASSSQAGVYVVQDGKFQYVNHHAAAYAGYSAEELVGMNSMGLVHPEDRVKVRKQAREMLRGRRISPHEFRIVTKDGRIRWIMETVAFIPYRGSRAVLGNSMDITETIEGRNRLEALEALEASILEAIPHAVIGLQDRRIIFANDGVQSVFGWDALELIGKSVRVFYRSDADYEAIARVLYGALEKHRTFKMEFTCRRKDGTDVDCMITASRIGESLTEGNIVITYQDITDLKRAKTEVEQSRERLRNLSAHLESAREKERTRIARDLHDELGQLLTALNTDLVLLMNSVPPGQDDLMKKAEDSVNLVEMTMQTVKRIYMDLRPGMLDHLGLAVAIDWLAQDFQKRTGIKCTVSIDPGELQLDADMSFSIYRIVQETLTNISRHAEASRVTISLRQSADRVELVVRDNGKGITQEQLAKPNSYGLLGIRERAYHWGGEALITGRRNQGTTVKVSIPLTGKGRGHEKDPNPDRR
ncbi:MAG: Sensor histidine kinase LiaS [Syntrophaceae bacterium PtaB.Bin038]|nr:MAG: Sensor histidine kinase LiaS [Syntrophaceae bacterium PtaB.Bin038]